METGKGWRFTVLPKQIGGQSRSFRKGMYRKIAEHVHGRQVRLMFGEQDDYVLRYPATLRMHELRKVLIDYFVNCVPLPADITVNKIIISGIPKVKFISGDVIYKVGTKALSLVTGTTDDTVSVERLWAGGIHYA